MLVCFATDFPCRSCLLFLTLLLGTVLLFTLLQDHSGVSNAQLVKEGAEIAERYKQRSVAEQNSLDLSWNLLMDDQFESLRSFLFPSQNELIRFRQLVVNVRSLLYNNLLRVSCCHSLNMFLLTRWCPYP